MNRWWRLLSKTIGRGTSFGAPTEAETLLANEIVEAIPSIEMVRLVNSGTEAVMSALRLARAATGRQKIVKCFGCYHGHVDALLVSAGSGALTLGTPSSPGVPEAVAQNTLLAQFNDLAAAEELFRQYPESIACVIIEPIPGNMGVIIPNEGYLQGLRDLCTKHGALLIFDEVMTGFRVAYGGAQKLYNITPDLTCLGKIIGGGLPVGAYGGPTRLMEQVSPVGPVYQAGTLSGNPLATSAGLATLEILKDPKAYETLEMHAKYLADSLIKTAKKTGVKMTLNRMGSMFTPFFTKEAGAPVTNYEQAKNCDTAAYAKFFNGMLERGVYAPPSQFEAWFVGLAHTPEDLDTTIKAAGAAMRGMV